MVREKGKKDRNSAPPVGLEPTTSERALRLKCMEGCVEVCENCMNALL